MKKDTRGGHRFGCGFLIIGVYTELKAFPVCDAEVKIRPSDGGGEVCITARTDARGFSPAVALALSKKQPSEISEKVIAYDFFDVTVSKPGYREVAIKRLPVFDGVISVRGCDVPSEK